MRAWLFDRVLVVDPRTGVLSIHPSRVPGLMLGGVLVGSAIVHEVSASRTLASMLLTLVIGLLGMALAAKPWFTPSRAVELRLREKTVSIDANAPVCWTLIMNRPTGYRRTRLSVRTETGEEIELLDLANGGLEFANALIHIVAQHLSGDRTLEPLRAPMQRLRRQGLTSALMIVGVAVLFAI